MNTLIKRKLVLAWGLIVFFGFVQIGHSQSGSRGGVTSRPKPPAPKLTLESAQSFIVVEGKSILSVEPTSIRIVLALTSEAATSRECKAELDQKINQLRQLWNQAGVDNDRIVEDFIAVLPRYEFERGTLGDQEVAQEKKIGYTMQSNIHLAVKDKAEVTKVLGVAFANEVTDIIGFDFWSEELDQKKEEARAKAIQVAKKKSKTLLDGLFEKTPPAINVQENTIVVYPETMYESFANTSSNEYQTNYLSRRSLPLIKVARPKNTYYRGNLTNADTQTAELQMQAKLSVVSTVRIYYESPAAKNFNARGKE